MREKERENASRYAAQKSHVPEMHGNTLVMYWQRTIRSCIHDCIEQEAKFCYRWYLSAIVYAQIFIKIEKVKSKR